MTFFTRIISNRRNEKTLCPQCKTIVVYGNVNKGK